MSEAGGWWFVDPTGQKQGPFTWVALTEMHALGAIDDATLVWTAGMYEWETFSALLGRESLAPAPTTSAAVPAGQRDHIDTHPWRRLFAKSLDVSVLGFPLLLALIYGTTYLFPDDSAGFLRALDYKIVGAVVLHLSWLPVEILLLAFVGTTPARWLFGISVQQAGGGKLRFAQAGHRSLQLYAQGLGAGIPIVSLIAQAFGFQQLSETGSTPWDESAASRVTHQQWGPLRAMVCTLAVFAPLVVLVI